MITEIEKLQKLLYLDIQNVLDKYLVMYLDEDRFKEERIRDIFTDIFIDDVKKTNIKIS